MDWRTKVVFFISDALRGMWEKIVDPVSKRFFNVLGNLVCWLVDVIDAIKKKGKGG
jgi:hypothetical protein